MIYLDTSALVKLVVREAESAALARWLQDTPGQNLVTSAIGRIELMRAAMRTTDRDVIVNARELLDSLDILAITDAVVDIAETTGPALLRTLDAVHLASIAYLGDAVTTSVIYDRRLIEACDALDIPVTTPM